MNNPVNPLREPVMVTRAPLPPLEEYIGYLRQIWHTHSLTNNGPFVQELEQRLRDYLGCSHLWYVNNCTTALQIAIKALALRGEVITTPFSYVATTGVIIWENCTPVFVDVRPGDLTIDPAQIEAAVTPRTSAILATHVYGFPCDVAAIEGVARRHGLKVIYDAAHAFGCKLNGRSLSSFGNVSCLSFHATKVFHTAEGGAVVINGDAALTERARLMRAFGHFGDDHHCIGINGKNSELHAALGLCNLPRVESSLALRRTQHDNYSRLLAGSRIRLPRSSATNFEYNYGYFPVILPNETAVLLVLRELAQLKIHPRRYFYPSLNRLPYVAGPACAVSEQAAVTTLCLPISDMVTPEIQEQVVAALIRAATA
jgi:dTDP-4-amino-4,6-dideoxygalactose transaminase